ncbi:MAG: pyruvate kinase [Planctomyces sp.]|nr:pyruvate kinase [Planctomyces sp.]
MTVANSQHAPWKRTSRTKIVATIGPACSGVDRLVELVRAGVDVFRINTAHGTRDDHQAALNAVRAAEERLESPVGVLVDLAGPKMRLTELDGGEVQCVTGESVRILRAGPPGPGELASAYLPLLDELRPGNRVMLADGTVSLLVERVEPGAAYCTVVQGGVVRSRQGINLPGVKLSAPAVSPEDAANAEWAATAGADYISLSFVRRADDVRGLRRLLRRLGAESHICAKIEKPEALADLEAIIEEADCVMVARGDLGVEIDIAQMAVVQKRIVAACRKAFRPVIIATQMLDSMHHSRLPTRAEATDVANAILDGADACMLSGETAVGKYPVESVEMMHRIAIATEPLLQRPPVVRSAPGISPITAATTSSAVEIAESLGAKLVIVASASGLSALCVSQQRGAVPIVGVSESAATLRRLCLHWGVIPLPNMPLQDDSRLLDAIISRGLATGDLTTGDRLILLSGTGLPTSRHNMLLVHEIG